ncbi:MAG: alpha-mannosidase [Trueperaceae bacterium]|nr:MAG: alpha-mannosidase [Trueperaceae bacterium]
MTRDLQTLTVRLAELAAYRDRWTRRIEHGRFRAHGVADAVDIAVGQRWPSSTFPVGLSFDTEVPPVWRGHAVNVRLSVGGEGYLRVNGRGVGGLNPYHQEHPVLAVAEGGDRLRLEVEAVPKSLFGRPNHDPTLERALLVVPDADVRALHHDLDALLATAVYLAKRERPIIAELLAEVVATSLRDIGLNRADSDAYLARLVQSPAARAEVDGIWEGWRFDGDAAPLPDDLRARIPELRARLRTAVERVRERYPAEGSLWLTGHAHIDLAWLWPLEETRRKAVRTFETVLGLMDRYPHFHFNQSSAQLYAYVEEDDPALFERIRARVAEGRWDVVGGMWVEPDGNLLAGESWARQLLHGQRYFERAFGVRARVCWLPDTFGYTGNLPQLLAQAGVPSFFTTKLNWNETDTFPHDLYEWEGLDGTRVLAHAFYNPNGGYNGHVEPFDLGETWRHFRGKQRHDQSLLSFGYGDGGGGPTDAMLEAFERLRDVPGLPRLEMGRVETFFERVDRSALPVWVGEKYLEFHRGTYTTQARTKALHRRLEHELVAAEAAATLAALGGADDPHDTLYDAWTVLLRNQFHDILPGSSIRTVYETAEREMGEALQRVTNVRDVALGTLSAPGARALVVWNLSLDARPLRCATPIPAGGAGLELTLADGTPVPHARTDTQLLVSLEHVRVPALGYLTLYLGPPGDEAAGSDAPGDRAASQPGAVSGSANELENEHLRIRVAADGTLESVYDKDAAREVLAGRGNALWAYVDVPRQYEAWEIDHDYERDGVEVVASQPPELVEAGPVRASLRVTRRFEQSTIVQEYRLSAGARRLDVVTRVDWRGRRQLLRALFPLAVRHHEATFETAFGAVARPTHRNTSWDEARFEVPGHRWADISEAGYGASLVNDAKYGYSAHGGTLGLTLLRAPVFPDPFADEGEHEFTYALYPHTGDWRTGTVAEGHDLNSPLVVVAVPADGAEGGAAAGTAPGAAAGAWRPERSFVACDTPSLRLASLKRAEDGDDLVLRLYDAHGARGTARLTFDLPIAAARACDLLEEPLSDDEARVEDGRLAVPFTPYGVTTWRLRLG